ncbi:MAG: ribbon-helix-helix protein, CopG family [Solirubrobacteraceae bacterium]|nr:ribbon-helix-helix protein, CopG family [Solirubrobacteraceae bacterium]
MENDKPLTRFTVPLDPDDYAELERRAAEERIPKTAHVRRLIAADARQHPAHTDLPLAA